MISCRELSHLVGRYHSNGLDDILRRNYYTKDVIVSVAVDAYGIAKTETLLFINDEAVYRLIELSAVRAWDKYTA